MAPNDKMELPRLIIYPSDIERIFKCDSNLAQRYYSNVRRRLKKKRGAQLTYKEFCKAMDLYEEDVVPYMQYPPVLPPVKAKKRSVIPMVVKIAVAASLFFCFTRLPFPNLFRFNEDYKDMIKWEIKDSKGYQKGYMMIKDTITGKMEKVTIEVQEPGTGKAK